MLPPRPGRTGAATAREAGPLLPAAADDLGRRDHRLRRGVVRRPRRRPTPTSRRAEAAADAVAIAPASPPARRSRPAWRYRGDDAPSRRPSWSGRSGGGPGSGGGGAGAGRRRRRWSRRFSDHPDAAARPGSAAPDGSRALARVLAGYGTTVQRDRSLRLADGRGARRDAVVVTAPDDYSDAQLRRAARGRAALVLVRPGIRAAAALAARPSTRAGRGTGRRGPGCPDAGRAAAGRADASRPTRWPTATAPGCERCYGGGSSSPPRLVGPRLGRAAAATSTWPTTASPRWTSTLITDSGAVTTVVWLLPGADAAGSGPASVWDLFPDGAYRAFWWLVAVGVLVVLWRARRLGGVVAEPLPVVVRAAEVVEGHGRLYRRAGARDRAAAALRAAGRDRLAARLGAAARRRRRPGRRPRPRRSRATPAGRGRRRARRPVAGRRRRAAAAGPRPGRARGSACRRRPERPRGTRQ